MYKTGVIMGKFYPFHLGHKFLIDSGAAKCKELYVIIVWRHNEFIAPETRLDWIQSTYKNNPHIHVILLEDKDYDQDSSQVWADLTEETIGFKPDAVITSEEYGHTWAECLGCAHILVNQARDIVPISGTLVRSDPQKYMDYLLPAVQDYFKKDHPKVQNKSAQ